MARPPIGASPRTKSLPSRLKYFLNGAVVDPPESEAKQRCKSQRIDQAPALGDILCKGERRLSPLLNAHRLLFSLIKRAISFGLNLHGVGYDMAAAAALWEPRCENSSGSVLPACGCPKRDVPQLHDRCDL